MFYYIKGKLAHLDPTYAVVDAGGVGYKLTISASTHSQMPPHRSVSEAPEVTLYSYMAVREDGIELFGFATEEELDSFKMLITVSGVGPKAAISILSLLSPQKLALAICTDDKKTISKANGIGPKTAARIVLELKDKLKKVTVLDGDDVGAFVKLGITFAGGHNYLLSLYLVDKIFSSSLIKLRKHVIKQEHGIFAGVLFNYLSLCKLQA